MQFYNLKNAIKKNGSSLGFRGAAEGKQELKLPRMRQLMPSQGRGTGGRGLHLVADATTLVGPATDGGGIKASGCHK